MRFLIFFLRCCIKRRRALEPRDHRHSQLRDNIAVVALLCTKPSFQEQLASLVGQNWRFLCLASDEYLCPTTIKIVQRVGGGGILEERRYREGVVVEVNLPATLSLERSKSKASDCAAHGEHLDRVEAIQPPLRPSARASISCTHAAALKKPPDAPGPS